MQSYIEVDKEGLYTLKINCKGKRIVGKANKEINVEKMIIGLKIKWGGGKENSTELQKPNIEAKVYNNNNKCDWGKKHSSRA